MPQPGEQNRPHKDFHLPSTQERLNIAVFIDFDNIEIGVRTTLGEHFDVGIILAALDRKSTRLNSSHTMTSRMPSSA